MRSQRNDSSWKQSPKRSINTENTNICTDPMKGIAFVTNADKVPDSSTPSIALLQLAAGDHVIVNNWCALTKWSPH